MAGGGWDTISEGTTTLPMGSAAIVATRMVQQRQNVRMVVTYFFTDGSYSSASLVPFQLNQMLHRFSRRPHLGALVRIRVPVNRSIADSAMLTQDFARDVLPGIVLGLRRAQAGS
jgi:EpsI family protein